MDIQASGSRGASLWKVLSVCQCVVILALCVVLVVHLVSRGEKIRATEIALVDSTGQDRILLAVDSSRASMVFLDTLGHERLVLASGDEFSSVSFWRDTSQVSLSLLGRTPSLVLRDSSGVSRTAIGLDSLSATYIRVEGPNGDGGVSLVANEVISAIGILDNVDSVRVLAANLNTGSLTGPFIYVQTRNQRSGVQIGVGTTMASDGSTDTYTESSMRIFGANGMMSWHAPW